MNVTFLDKATAQCALLGRAGDAVVNENEANCLWKSVGGEGGIGTHVRHPSINCTEEVIAPPAQQEMLVG
jgi:hypothetical protein